MAELDDIDIAELNAQAFYTAARKLTHLSDELWNVARHDAVAAAKLIIEHEEIIERKRAQIEYDGARRAARNFMGSGT